LTDSGVSARSDSVRWGMEKDGHSPEQLRIDWQESGGPAVYAPTRTGFGHMVITRLVPRALDGNASLDFRSEGLSWTLKVPQPTLSERAETPESVKRALS
jgi:two-component sensor histidine kinase